MSEFGRENGVWVVPIPLPPRLRPTQCNEADYLIVADLAARSDEDPGIYVGDNVPPRRALRLSYK